MDRLSERELEEIRQMAMRARENARLPAAMRLLLVAACIGPIIVGVVLLWP